jgi:ribose-phosphate pyrophosphokinase
VSSTLLLVSGPASPMLARRVADAMKTKTMQLEHKVFPDGETYIRLAESVEGECVAVIQSCYPPQNKNLVDLLFILDAAREMGAKKVAAVVPYFAYARQDDRYRSGEAVSAKTSARLIEAAGATHFLTIDVPSNKALQFFTIHSDNLTCMNLMGEYLKRRGLWRPYVLAPDDGAIPLAETVSAALQAEYAWFEKSRDKITGAVSTSGKDVDLKGRDTVIVDDVISTGKTIANASQIAKKQGAERVIAACAHRILTGEAENTLKAAGVEETIGTDSIETRPQQVSIAPVIAEALRKIW